MKEERSDRNNDKTIFGVPMKTAAVHIRVTTKHTQPYKQTTP